jgi:4-diphosphocytidyl-2-C-methyl-D-erythritol kinase
MIVFPNAKINIGLSVTERRKDGYHNLETIFFPVSVCDALEIIESNQPNFYTSGLPVAGDGRSNLVWKAYELIRTRFPKKIRPVEIHLHKNIPMGAGMGGGSADAAFMLMLLNEYFELKLSQQQLLEFALVLGSDCPFFIINEPAFASGRGELLAPLKLDLQDYNIQVICPHIHISTAQAFSGIVPKAATFDLKKIATLPVEAWQSKIFNDFEHSVFNVHPTLRSIKNQLYEAGALYASMSGTGSSIYGIFLKGKKAIIESKIDFQEFYS